MVIGHSFMKKSYTAKIFWKILLQNVSNIPRKAPMLESLFNKVSGLQAWSFIRKRLQHRCFHVNIAKYLRTPILMNICQQLLLNFIASNGKISTLDTYVKY